VRLGIGIGQGEVLDLDGRDVFGHEVNLASRLGEDLSAPGEILLTPGAHAVIGEPAEPMVVNASSLELSYWRLVTG
jgi:class 3 adenylate cyclase